MVGDRLEQRALLVGERRVPVGDELADFPPFPAERRADGVGAGASFGPCDPSVLEHERRARRVHRVHRRLHDRLERLLEVERLGDGLRDPRERLELRHAALGIGVQLRVHDRLRHLRGDRDEQVDLGRRELARRPRPDVQGARELLAREDRDGEDRLVLVLGQVGKRLEARIEVGLCGNHHRHAVGRGRARDPLARTHARTPRHALDSRSVRRAQHELIRTFVVEVDEARVRGERVRDLARDERQDFLEVERRIDRFDRLRQQAQMPFANVHGTIVAAVLPGP